MPIRVTCPACKASYSCPDEHRGKSLRCAKCKHVFRVAADPAPIAVEPLKEPSGKAGPGQRAADAPAPLPKKRGIGVFVLVGAVVVLFVLCAGVTVGGGALYFLLLRPRTPVAGQALSPVMAGAAGPRAEPVAPADLGPEKPVQQPVKAPQAPPQAEKLSVRVVAGKPFHYSLPAGTSLRYELASGPPGMTVTSRGDVDWVPRNDARGSQEFTVRAVEGDQVQLLRYQVEVVAEVTVAPAPPIPAGGDGLLKDQSTLPVKAFIGKPFSFQFPNGGRTVKYELHPGLKQRLKGLDLTPDGLLTWTSPVGSPTRPLALSVMVNGRPTIYQLEIQEDPETTLALEVPGGWVMLPDGVTLIVSVPDKAQLIYVDTLTNKESKRVNLDFKPAALAFQGQNLLVAVEGAGQLRVLDAATGSVKKEVQVSAAPLLALACHPAKGAVYASDTQMQIWAIDPASGQVADTQAQGMFLAVDPVEGDVVYAGIQGQIKKVIEIRRVGSDRYMLQPGVLGERAVLLKYSVKGGGLQAVAANNNAAANGRVLRVSPDGKRVGIVGGGGYRPPAGAVQGNADPYGIALFGTDDVKALAGLVTCGGFPNNLAFHPVLDLGVAEQAGGLETKLHFFKSKALSEFNSIAFGEAGAPATSPDQLMASKKAEEAHLLTFGGKGTKLIYYDGHGAKPYLRLIPLELSHQDREALVKAYGK
jgi:predicted Zn finger-like uncharacterized protein